MSVVCYARPPPFAEGVRDPLVVFAFWHTHPPPICWPGLAGKLCGRSEYQSAPCDRRGQPSADDESVTPTSHPLQPPVLDRQGCLGLVLKLAIAWLRILVATRIQTWHPVKVLTRIQTTNCELVERPDG